MKKSQIFYIRKFDSDRLKESHYRIKNLTYEQSFLNGEIINISDSQLVRTLYRLTNRDFSEIKLKELLSEKKSLSRKGNSPENRAKLKRVFEKINELLFIPEVISIQFKDKRHFTNMVKRGLKINDVEYVYFMSSAGQTRRDQSLFIDKRLKNEIESIFNNGRNIEKELVPQKYSAYYSLYSSSSQKVTFPRICVVPDVTIKSEKTVNFSTYISPTEDPVIEKRTDVFEFNGADGQGFMSPEYAKLIGQDLELDYVPSAAIIRCSFLKGLLVTFDFKKFGKEIAKTNMVKDVYGNMININNIDIIVSQSQFKLWDSYTSTEQYVSNCVANQLDFSVSRVSPKEDKTSARSSYQFLQVLDFESEQDLINLCEPTINWLNGVSGEDVMSSLLFLLGDTNFESKWFERLDSPIKALLLENSLISDSFFSGYLDKNILKKKADAKLGRLIFNSNYSLMVADPYGQASVIFGMELTPLLADGQHFSNFWNERNVKKAVGIRSPIVHASEIDVLNFRNDRQVQEWYKHLNVGVVVFPLNGVGLDFVITGGADVDGDLICTINHESFLKGKPENLLPVMYESRKAPKIKIDKNAYDTLVNSQIQQVRSNKIGYYTNLASTYTAMLNDFEKGSVEHNAILNRLFYFRILQGETIDSTKGLIVNPFLEHWVKYKKVTDGMTLEERNRNAFNNNLLAEKRPRFFIHLYTHYMKRYKKEKNLYANLCITRFGVSLDELQKLPERTPEQQAILERYNRRTFFIDNNSTMNRISKHVEESLSKTGNKKSEEHFDYTSLLSKNFVKPNKSNIDKFKLLYKEYKSLKRNLIAGGADNNSEYSSADQIHAYINKKAYSTITNNSTELGNLSVYCSYQELGIQSRAFIWHCFGKELVDNIIQKKNVKFVRVPMPNPKGSIEYLWRKYGVYLLNMEEQND